MTWYWGLLERLRNLFRSRLAEKEMAEEIRFHLDRAIEKNIAKGMTPAEAERIARITFGGEERIKEQTRRERGVHVLTDLLHDIRYAARDLLRRPGFSAVVILSLILCVGANTAIFSLVNTVVLRPLPYPDSDRIVYVYNSYPGVNEDRAGNNYIDYYERRERVEAFEEVALYSYGGGVVGEGETQRHVFTTAVTPSYFTLLGIQPHAGRFFIEADGQATDNYEVVISHSFWQQYFGGMAEDGIVGGTLVMNETRVTVVGILPADFRVPTWDTDVFTPMSWPGRAWAEELRFNDEPELEMLARLVPGATVEEARDQIAAINTGIVETMPEMVQEIINNAGFNSVVRTWQTDLLRNLRRPLLLLWGGALFVLLIGCVNITNLLLIRTSSALPDLATRHALGAGRMRLLRQRVTESLFLCILGGAAGIAVGTYSLKLLSAFAVWDIPLVSDVRLDGASLLFTGSLILLVGLLAGLVPAVRSLRGNRLALFLLGGRTSEGRRHIVSLQNLLVSAQVAVTFVLLMGAALLFASLRNILAIEPGFEADGILANAISLPWERYQDEASRVAFQEAIIEEIESIPGVESAAIVSQIPFSGIANSLAITPEGYDWSGAGESVTTPYNTRVSPGYFACMGIPLLRGREFTSDDRQGSPHVVIIDENLARRYWPGTDPIGKRMHPGVHAGEEEDDNPPVWHTIVGVVGSIKHNDLLETDPGGAFYRPVAQSGLAFFRTVIRTAGEPLTFNAAVREAIVRVDPAVYPYWTTDLSADLYSSLIPRRTPMRLLTSFALMALLLATLGVYGVMAYAVGQRSREIGIRMALGSTGGRIVSLIGRQWLRMVGLGLVVGIIGTVFLTRVITSQLYGVAPTDPLVFLTVILILGAVACSACLLPVVRALRLDPVAVLRVE